MSAFLNGIPGLTPRRLSEMWRSILHVTQDPAAIGNVTYFARGGIRIEIHWKQNGISHTYPATLTAEDVASVLDVDEDTLFSTFATQTLEAVREMGNKLAGAEMPADHKPDFTPPTGAMDSLVGALRAGALVSPTCVLCGETLTAERMRDCSVLDCPNSSPPAGAAGITDGEKP